MYMVAPTLVFFRAGTCFFLIDGTKPNCFQVLTLFFAPYILNPIFFWVVIKTKGQEISEWKYGVIPLPKIWTKKFEKFCPEYLGQNFSIFFVRILSNATTSNFHSEISWSLLLMHFMTLSWLMKKTCMMIDAIENVLKCCLILKIASLDKCP